ncbi:MAG: DNA polymerase III subunit gamma/tau [Myxococcota bacterium]
MSYQVLARKWRPTSFEEVAGQSHVTTALRNAISTDRIPHAILLSGPRGVGKTTIARLLARALNCEKGPTPEPCGSCSFCTEIAEGRSTDVQEIDAASRTSVDDVREIIESIRYAPTPGKWRIYVVDEVHMLSTAAFNALLKTLEEPPPRSLFVFATTNPEKIPYTVVSRCQRHDLRRLPAAETIARLREIADAEGIRLSEGSLLSLAREGEGSLRDSLTLLDQLVAVGGTEPSDEQVAQILDLIDRRILNAIVSACLESDPAAALAAAGRAADAGIDAKRLGGALVRLLRDLTVLRIAPDQPDLVEGSDAELEELRAIANQAEPARLRRMFRALVREQEDLTWAPEPFAVLEMAIVRLATLASGEDASALLARLAALEQQLAGGGNPGGGNPAGGNPAGGSSPGGRSGGSAPPAGPGRGTPPRTNGGGTRSAPAEEASDRREPEQAPHPADRPARAAESAESPEPPAREAAPSTPAEPLPEGPPAASAPLAAVYDRLRVFAQSENRGLFAALEGGRLLDRKPGQISVELPSSIGARRLAGRIRDLEEVCARLFGQPTSVKVQIADSSKQRERVDRAAVESAARDRRREALSHPAINTALEILGGEILEIRSLGKDSETSRS